MEQRTRNHHQTEQGDPRRGSFPHPYGGVPFGGGDGLFPSTKTFSTYGPTCTISAAQLYQMQWQSLQQMHDSGVAGSFMPPTMPQRLPMSLMPSHMPYTPSHMPHIRQPSPLPHAMLPSTMGSSATAMTRKMVLESASAMAGCIDSGGWMKRQLKGSDHHQHQHRCGSSDDSDASDDGESCGQSSVQQERATKMTAEAENASSLAKEMDHEQALSRRNERGSEEVMKPRKESESKSAYDVLVEEQPKRRLSAYNLFFQHERARLLILAERGASPENHPPHNLRKEEIRELLNHNPYYIDRAKRRHRKSHGKVSFMDLVKHVSRSWKNIDKVTRASFEALANEDKVRYQREMKQYKLRMRKRKQQASQSDPSYQRQPSTPPALKTPSPDQCQPSPVTAAEPPQKRTKADHESQLRTADIAATKSARRDCRERADLLQEALRIVDLAAVRDPAQSMAAAAQDFCSGSGDEGEFCGFDDACSHENIMQLLHL